MTLASVKTFLEMSGADREASEIVAAAGVKISDPTPDEQQGYAARYVRVFSGRQNLVQR